MQKSDSISKLAQALSIVQGKLTPASKDSKNPFFNSHYADLNSVWDSCRQLLAENGLSVIQGNSVGLENTVIVETVLAHASGEWIQSELCLPLAKKDPQGVGSAVTYGRRYGLAAIVGIVADVDDDGNGASNKPNSLPPTRPNGNMPPPIESNRDKLASKIQQFCKDLNAAKDPVTWNKAKLNEYTEAMFGDGINYENANEKQLATLAADLNKRLSDISKPTAATGGK